MVITTHRDFKSIVSNVKDAETINKRVVQDLERLRHFNRYTPKSERKWWTDEELSNLKIDVEKITRLYHLSHKKIAAELEARVLACAMIYKNSKLYILMITFTHSKNESRGEEIFLTFNPRRFVDHLSINNNDHYVFDMAAIISSLKEDEVKAFKSFVPHIKDVETINTHVGHILERQDKFVKSTSRREYRRMSRDEISIFKIDLEKIVRLYHLLYRKNSEFETHELACAMVYQDSIVYILMTTDHSFMGGKRNGEIYFTRNPDAFVHHMFEKGRDYYQFDMVKIIRTLKDDVLNNRRQTKNF